MASSQNRLSKILNHFQLNNEFIKPSDTSSTSFRSDEIITDVVDNEPNELLTVSYKSGVQLDKMGTILTPTQVQNKPVNVAFVGSKYNKRYTIILTDPDARDRQKHEFREWIHCVRVNVPGYDLVNGGHEIIQYVGSGPVLIIICRHVFYVS